MRNGATGGRPSRRYAEVCRVLRRYLRVGGTIRLFATTSGDARVAASPIFRWYKPLLLTHCGHFALAKRRLMTISSSA